MKIALINAPFKNGRTEENIDEMIRWVQMAAASGAQLAVFGEAALQGFDAPMWHYQEDLNVAENLEGEAVEKIRQAARCNAMAVSFGLIEKANGTIFSSQVTLDPYGNTLHVFRRVSSGWKTESADAHYAEGEGFTCFEWMGKRFAVALCGDMWYDENVEKLKLLHADCILWPVYCDYGPDEWNMLAKYEYAQQAGKASGHVLWVNPYCNDSSNENRALAQGGAVHFKNGKIIEEKACGSNGMLITEI